MGEIHSVLTDVYDVYEQLYYYFFSKQHSFRDLETEKYETPFMCTSKKGFGLIFEPLFNLTGLVCFRDNVLENNYKLNYGSIRFFLFKNSVKYIFKDFRTLFFIVLIPNVSFKKMS